MPVNRIAIGDAAEAKCMQDGDGLTPAGTFGEYAKNDWTSSLTGGNRGEY